jgi:hypothetical protein
MAHCVNCDALISDRPEHGDFCSEDCYKEYKDGATNLVTEALTVYEPIPPVTPPSELGKNIQDLAGEMLKSREKK